MRRHRRRDSLVLIGPRAAVGCYGRTPRSHGRSPDFLNASNFGDMPEDGVEWIVRRTETRG